jgi:preprotein translocase subunit SecF
MLNYLIFFIIALILIFIIYIGAKGLSRGIEAKSKLKEEKTKSEKNSNIVDEIEKLSDLRKKKIITEKEFEIAKKKLFK